MSRGATALVVGVVLVSSRLARADDALRMNATFDRATLRFDVKLENTGTSARQLVKVGVRSSSTGDFRCAPFPPIVAGARRLHRPVQRPRRRDRDPRRPGPLDPEGHVALRLTDQARRRWIRPIFGARATSSSAKLRKSIMIPWIKLGRSPLGSLLNLDLSSDRTARERIRPFIVEPVETVRDPSRRGRGIAPNWTRSDRVGQGPERRLRSAAPAAAELGRCEPQAVGEEHPEHDAPSSSYRPSLTSAGVFHPGWDLDGRGAVSAACVRQCQPIERV
jgi:hypothetical protein